MLTHNAIQKVIFAFFFSLTLTASGHAVNGKNHIPLKYDDSTMHCYNPTTGIEIGFYIGTQVVVFPGIPEEDLYKGIEKNRIFISYPDGTEHLYTHGVLAMTDGHGNTQYTVSWVDTNYQQQQVINLYFNFNLGYLQGHYTPFTTDIYNVDTLLTKQPVTNKMDCYTYTWGNF